MNKINIENPLAIKRIMQDSSFETKLGKTVIFTSGNGWYLDTLIFNLVVSMRRNDSKYADKLTVVCTDTEAVKKCLQLGIENYILVKIPALGVESFTQNHSNDIEKYTRLCFVKTVIMSFLLDLGITGIYIDPDMAFVKPAIDDIISKAVEKPIVFAGRPEYLNTNIMVARPTEPVKSLFNLKYEHVQIVLNTEGLYGDEDYIRECYMRNIRLFGMTHYLSSEEYPNGRELGKHRTTCRMAHANCVQGLINKIQLLKSNGVWFL